MIDMVYTKKDTQATFTSCPTRFYFKLDKPMLCPICGAYVDSTRVDAKLFSRDVEPSYGIVQYRCTHCTKTYLVAYELNSAERSSRFRFFLPHLSNEYENEIISNFSLDFIRYYNQALRSELAGDTEIAAIGYRTAIEFLIKDYAINELGKPREEVVQKKLMSAISEYMGERDLIATADVVRILGNDYTHYERRHPEHDLTLLKQYLEIFIKLVEMRYLIAHPPLARQDRTQPV